MKEIIYYCDVCEKKIEKFGRFYLTMRCQSSPIITYRIDYNDICEECANEIHKTIKEVVNKKVV